MQYWVRKFPDLLWISYFDLKIIMLDLGEFYSSFKFSKPSLPKNLKENSEVIKIEKRRQDSIDAPNSKLYKKRKYEKKAVKFENLDNKFSES